jgi:hypothetical protein
MASEFTFTIWSDGPADRSTAHSVGTEAAASIHRATGLATALADFDARQIEPTDCVVVDVDPDLPVYGPDDSAEIVEHGVVRVKAPNPVFLVELDHECVVATNEGPLRAHAGDFLAHDPISGHVWPVAADYVAQHYVDPTEVVETEA